MSNIITGVLFKVGLLYLPFLVLGILYGVYYYTRKLRKFQQHEAHAKRPKGSARGYMLANAISRGSLIAGGVPTLLAVGFIAFESDLELVLDAPTQSLLFWLLLIAFGTVVGIRILHERTSHRRWLATHKKGEKSDH